MMVMREMVMLLGGRGGGGDCGDGKVMWLLLVAYGVK